MAGKYIVFADRAEAKAWFDAANADIGADSYYGVDRDGQLQRFATLKGLETWHLEEWEAPCPDFMKVPGKPGRNAKTGRWMLKNQRDVAISTLITHQDAERPDPVDKDERVVAWIDPDSTIRDADGIEVTVSQLRSKPTDGTTDIAPEAFKSEEFQPSYDEGFTDDNGDPVPDVRAKRFNSPEPGERDSNGDIVPGGPKRNPPEVAAAPAAAPVGRVTKKTTRRP